MLSICKISLKKILRADEDGRLLFLHNECLLPIFFQMQME